jgi:NAD(P)-dependent dehydrogenase (short-subunit alcohol dehydrogenase family)
VAYTAPKAAMENLVQAVAREFGCKGIRANAIAPGLTDTELASPMSTIPGVIEAFAREYPLGRIGTVQDVAAATAYLASDECFITGQTLDVNGGLTLRRNPTPA